MSRIGKKPIAIAPKTTVEVTGRIVTVKGALGSLSREIPSEVSVEVKDNTVFLTTKSVADSAIWGTSAAHIKNMIEGVNKGYTKKLIVEGIGYKADIKGADLILSVGFSHTVPVKIPAGLKVTSEKNVITITGIDKELVGNFAAGIHAVKKPEPYKGKGIRYEGQIVRRKQGKKAA
ncbi:MAG TPA: 50S ribosomal protein L6 [Candidatus Paceibacterota bacterium]|nr:50S ribosomal protein L6 [Candidatus Paceibacterota bacterium]